MEINQGALQLTPPPHLIKFHSCVRAHVARKIQKYIVFPLDSFSFAIVKIHVGTIHVFTLWFLYFVKASVVNFY